MVWASLRSLTRRMVTVEYLGDHLFKTQAESAADPEKILWRQ